MSNKKVEYLVEYINHLHGQRFSGTLTVVFDCGWPNELSKRETIKVDDLRQVMKKPVFVLRKKAEVSTQEAPSPNPEETPKEEAVNHEK